MQSVRPIAMPRRFKQIPVSVSAVDILPYWVAHSPSGTGVFVMLVCAGWRVVRNDRYRLLQEFGAAIVSSTDTLPTS